jgi:cytochrome c553
MRAVTTLRCYAALAAVMISLSDGTRAAHAQAAAPARPAQLGLCASCHGEDGRGREPGTPHLAAQDETYLRQALQAYRAGQRKHAAMQAIAGALSQADIAAFARWYAAQGRTQ